MSDPRDPTVDPQAGDVVHEDWWRDGDGKLSRTVVRRKHDEVRGDRVYYRCAMLQRRGPYTQWCLITTWRAWAGGKKFTRQEGK